MQNGIRDVDTYCFCIMSFTSKIVAVWQCGNAAMWQCGNVAVWQCGNVACGSVGVWQCGSVAVWQCDNVDQGIGADFLGNLATLPHSYTATLPYCHTATLPHFQQLPSNSYKTHHTD